MDIKEDDRAMVYRQCFLNLVMRNSKIQFIEYNWAYLRIEDVYSKEIENILDLLNLQNTYSRKRCGHYNVSNSNSINYGEAERRTVA